MSGSGGNWGFASSQTTQQKLGRYGMKRNQYAAQPISTGFSRMDQGNVTLDPSIRAIQEQGLARNNNLYNQLGSFGQEILGNLRGTRSRYEGNQSAYLQSRINPVEQEFSQRQGGLQRSIGMRGLAGSSFGDQALNNLATEKQRTLGDVRAQAEMENLQALTGIDAQMAQTMFQNVAQQMQITGMDLDTAKTRLQQELQALGLGQAQVKLMADQFENYQRRMLYNLQDVSHTDNISYSSGMGGGGEGGIS